MALWPVVGTRDPGQGDGGCVRYVAGSDRGLHAG